MVLAYKATKEAAPAIPPGHGSALHSSLRPALCICLALVTPISIPIWPLIHPTPTVLPLDPPVVERASHQCQDCRVALSIFQKQLNFFSIKTLHSLFLTSLLYLHFIWSNWTLLLKLPLASLSLYIVGDLYVQLLCSASYSQASMCACWFTLCIPHFGYFGNTRIWSDATVVLFVNQCHS